MPKIKTYPGLYSHSAKGSSLPPDLQTLVHELGASIYERKKIGADLKKFREKLQQIEPQAYRMANTDIRLICYPILTPGLDIARPKRSGWKQWPDDQLREKRARNFAFHQRREPDIPFLLAMHKDGYVRERAIRKMTGALRSTFEVLLLADLANNWVNNVREAAVEAIERCYPKTSPLILASACASAAEISNNWTRWSSGQSERVYAQFLTEPVVQAMLDRLIEGREQRPSRTFRFIARSDHLDSHLERLAKSREPNARALAYAAMIDQMVACRVDTVWEWIDKPLGLRRRRPVIEHRALTLEFDTRSAILSALNDRSSKVRAIGAQALINCRSELTELISELVSQLLSDKSARVRSRAEYLNRVLSQSSR